MKTKNQFILLAALLGVASITGLHAQGTAFTYQGRLNDAGSPANGTYDFRFRLASDPLGNNYVGGAYLTNGIPVTNGLFTTTLDFGPGIFTGSNYWLEVDVRTNNGGSYTPLNPLQALTSTPYAITAGHVTGGGIAAGTYGNAVTFSNSANSFSGSGAGLTSLNASELSSGTVPEASLGNAWKISGNSGTSPTNGDFLGTVDSQPLEFRVNGQRAFRLESDTNGFGAPNVVGGAPNNFVDPGVIGATIAGGGVLNYATTNDLDPGPGANHVSAVWGTIGGGRLNTVSAEEGTVAGGLDNVINASGSCSAIGGGHYNTASGYSSTVGGGSGNINRSDYATVGGGGDNSIGTNANSGTVSGGFFNQIAANTHDSTIGGGSYGSIGTNSFASTIAGGSHNSIGNNANVAAIGGGTNNIASANSATVSGGADNTASGYASTVGGGLANTNRGAYDTIGGGYDNTASSPDGSATVGGGYYNTASGDSSAVNGGFDNIASGGYATVLGGSANTASALWATVGGGEGNTAAGAYSFAAGYNALALHNGSFVWADDTGSTFSSTAANQFLIRAGGGVGLNTASPGAALEVRTSNRNGDEIRFGYNGGGAGNLIAGSTYVGIATDDLVTRLAILQATGNVGIGTVSPDALLSVNGAADKPGGGSWNTFSDRRLKDVGGNFTNGLVALEGIQPVHYHYKADNPLKLPSQPEYVGVVAQQVQKAVPEAVQRSQSGYLVVNNDPIIWTMLNAIKELKAENDALQQRVKRLEREAALRSNQQPNGGVK